LYFSDKNIGYEAACKMLVKLKLGLDISVSVLIASIVEVVLIEVIASHSNDLIRGPH